jgi:circadian clock protein KaiB
VNGYIAENVGATFVLFVARDSPNSRMAIANLQRALLQLGSNPDNVRIVDVFEHPEEASEAHVLVTPTLLRASDSRTRIHGDLSNPLQLAAFLDAP